MQHLLIASGVFLAVLLPALLAMKRWQWQITEERKRLLDSILSLLQAAVLLAGGYWFAMKFVVSEQDLIGSRITVIPMTVDSEVAGLASIADGCRVFLSWGATNNGTAAGQVVRSTLVLRRYDLPENKEPPFIEIPDEAETVFSVDLPPLGSDLRPGSVHQWTRSIVLPQSPMIYSADAYLFVDGDSNPWTTRVALRCSADQFGLGAVLRTNTSLQVGGIEIR